MPTLLIKNARYIVSCDDKDTLYERTNLYIKDGVIASIGRDYHTADQIIDAPSFPFPACSTPVAEVRCVRSVRPRFPVYPGRNVRHGTPLAGSRDRPGRSTRAVRPSIWAAAP